MDKVTQFIRKHYPEKGRNPKDRLSDPPRDIFPYQNQLSCLWEWFKNKEFSDAHFECSFAPPNGKQPSHYQRFWEMALGHRLAHDLSVPGCLKKGETGRDGGPDWMIENSGNRIWVEATAPTYSGPDPRREDEKHYISSPSGANFVQPESIPAEAGRWLRNDDPDSGGYGRTFQYTFNLARRKHFIEVAGPEPGAPVVKNPVPPPYEPGDVVPILNANKSRWTQCLNEKAKKANAYLAEEKIGTQDPLIIAVNTSLLMWPNFDGISQLPMAVEVLFGAGPRAILLDRETGKQAGSAYNTEQRRFEIVKRSPRSIPIDSARFDQDCFKAVSAVIACDISSEIEAGLFIKTEEDGQIKKGRETIRWCLVHNPNATNPLPDGFMNSVENWHQTDWSSNRTLTCTPAENPRG